MTILPILNNLTSASLPGFGTAAFVGSLAYDDGLPSDSAPATPSNVTGGGVLSVDTNLGGLVGAMDWRFTFGGPNPGGPADRLKGGEIVSWDATGMGSSFPPVWNDPVGGLALHVQGIPRTVFNDDSGWYISAIPEPETYAMLLAGLGLIGFSLRRQKQ